MKRIKIKYSTLLFPVIFFLPFLSYSTDVVDYTSDIILARNPDYFSSIGVIKLKRKVKASDFTVQSLNGNTTSLSDFRGKVIFLNFWATWCGPCRSEVKDIDSLYKTLKDEDFTVMAIDIQESSKKIVSFMERNDIDFPVYLDSDGMIASQYGVSGIPTTFIIDPDGKIVGWAVGPREWGSMESVELMRSLMK